MPNCKRTPLRMSHDSGRRPIRPIDREKMRPWLERHLNQGSAPGVRWTDKSKGIFEIPWRHAARHGWSIEKDACIFEQWAIHTKKYIKGQDKEKDPKRWKANFRCALNSLPDVSRVTGRQGESKGSQAVRRYKFLSPDECKTKQSKARRPRRKYKYEEEDEEEDMEEIEELEKELTDNSEVDEEQTVPSPMATDSAIPNFEQLLPDSSDVVRGRSHSSTNHMSGCSVLQRTCATPPSPTQERSISPNSVESTSDSEVSHYSDEEAVECILQFENDTDSNLYGYHPSLWNLGVMDFNDDSMVANQVECETTEFEVGSVITLTSQPEYWDLTRNSA